MAFSARLAHNTLKSNDAERNLQGFPPAKPSGSPVALGVMPWLRQSMRQQTEAVKPEQSPNPCRDLITFPLTSASYDGWTGVSAKKPSC